MGVSINDSAFEVKETKFNTLTYDIFCANYLSDLNNFHAYGYLEDGIVKALISFYESVDEPAWYYTLYRSMGNNNLLRDFQINNPSNDPSYVFSDVVPIYTTDGYNVTPTEQVETWCLSAYVLGSGIVNLNLLAYGFSASGVQDITTGYISGSAFQYNLE
jgi:hypothetical protein